MIGVFDSGSGGLTVLAAAARTLPDQSFLYLGDHAHAPYGHRDNADILALTTAGVDRLMAAGCGLVVVACNTAAAVALRRIQQDWLPDHYPDHRVLGVLVPMVEALTGVPWHREEPTDESRTRGDTLAIFATEKTVEANSYVEEVEKRAPGMRVIQTACPGLVRAIETGADAATLKAMVHGFVGEARARLDGHQLAAVFLGCTHFPLIEDHFAGALPAGVRILSQPRIVAESLDDYLARHPDLTTPTATPVQRYLTTGDPDALRGIERLIPELKGRFERLG